VDLDSVSCESPGNCSAVGEYFDSSGNAQGLLLTEVAGSWATGTEATLPANAGSMTQASLGQVSCGAVGDCSAVGTYTDISGEQQGLLVTEVAGTWATGTEASLPANARPGTGASLSLVSCASAGSCSAVGWYAASGDQLGYPQWFFLSETDGSWAAGTQATLGPGAGQYANLDLSSVSCASAGNCTAIGNYSAEGVYVGFRPGPGVLWTEVAGTWEPGIEAGLPANDGPGGFAGGVVLSSVSCASAGNCTAGGEYTDSSGNGQGVLLSEAADTWSPGVEAVPPPNAGPYGIDAAPSPNAGYNPLVDLTSVSCPAVDACSAVGTYTDSSHERQGLLLSPSIPAPAPTPPVLSRLRLAPATFVLRGRRVNRRCVKATAKTRARPRCTRPIKLTVSYQLNGPATVMLTFTRVLPGRLVRRRCLAPTRKTRKHRGCTRLVALRGALTESGTRGEDRVVLTGRIAGHTLAAGSYRVTATPKADGQAGTPQTIAFTIAR
jgi:hypothetical protein